jgi:hypothetical protein
MDTLNCLGRIKNFSKAFRFTPLWVGGNRMVWRLGWELKQ